MKSLAPCLVVVVLVALPLAACSSDEPGHTKTTTKSTTNTPTEKTTTTETHEKTTTVNPR
jgi:ABC-type enterochelin transport system substrate-binding protein